MTATGIKAALEQRRVGPLLTTAVLLGLFALPVAIWFDLRDLAERMLRIQAGEVSHVIDDMRDYYATDVVGRVLAANGEAHPSHRYREINGGIPVPATLSIELGKRISGASDAVRYRFVSEFPFKGRESHNLDEFELSALAALRRDASEPIVSVLGALDSVRIRVASPVIMGAVCVACHNTHADSPKKDWVVGDIRGIQEISVVRPIAANLLSFKYLLLYFAFASISGFAFITVQRRQSRFVQTMNGELIAANGSLAATNAEMETQKHEIEKLSEERSRQNVVLEETIRARTRDLVVSQDKLEKLIEHGIALGAERDEKRLLENILLAAKDLANADGGTLYTKDGDNLEFQIVRNDSLGIKLGGTTGGAINFPPVKMSDPETGEPNHNNVASHAAITGESVNIADAYEAEGFDFSGTREFDERAGYRSTSFLTVPLKPRQGDVIGVLQLINTKDLETGEVVPFDAEIEGFVEALASQAAVALDNQNLLKALKILLDSFIELIASAIDAKSPHTGGHCARVPELARMLAEAACEEKEGPFAEFNLNTDQWYEFHIASWLHDCGKVTTPEYVVDKATKLETIYNRIHEVRTRFEVLIREANIEYLEGMLAGKEDPALLAKARDAALEQIRNDFDFIATCNVGGEYMDDEHKTRVREIAMRTWTRHLDDRIGVSRDEAERLARTPAPALPVVEPLLADRDDHVIMRENADPFGTNPWGFRMPVPEHLYNYGEVYNLLIDRGTLTSEERFKINDHIIQTIIMLEQLPFPENMKRVPEFAGGHHETMIGTGYPRQLTKDDMSVPARIMAIADIFEALTDPNRPYKEAKTLTESLDIMRNMVRDEHIDPDLFRLFLTAGIYRQYAEKFLTSDQINSVDIEQHLI